MSQISNEQVLQELQNIREPGFEQDIVSTGRIEKLNIHESRITVSLNLSKIAPEAKKTLKANIESQLTEKFPNQKILILESTPGLGMTGQSGMSAPQQQSAPRDPWAGRRPIPEVKTMIAVASGKGGVGKSTVSTNLAISLSLEGLEVGLMDSDIYGPSVQIMMGVDEKPMVSPRQKLLPIEKFGIKMMSMGFLVDKDAPLIWRGPMVTKAVEQFLRDVEWGKLDTLVIDLPPGTGDTQLTLVQKTPITGAIIVTTPQEVALMDARRGTRMFQKVDTPVLGIIENMSYFSCKKCGEQYYIFGKGGGSKAAHEMKVPFLGEIPIDPEVTSSGDGGVPIVAKNPESDVSRAYRQVAMRLISEGVFKD
jgi:ATP-binding protein involved in chromosome partitioning